MILLIDNYDSFVYNLARYIGELGHERIVKRNDAINLAEIENLHPSHIIISPGPCAPLQAGISITVVQYFMQRIPILGVCLGHQVIGHVLGGTVTRAKRPLHGQASSILHDGKMLFSGLPHPLRVGRYHSLIVSDENFPDKLTITARCEQGEIMAFQHQHYPLFGVQFHPESVLTEQGHQLLNNFLRVEKINNAWYL